FYGAVVNYSISRAKALPWPQPFRGIFDIFQLDQHWNIFAPNISRVSGWFVIPGKLRNGQEVDLYRDGAPVSWERPKLPSAEYKDERWRQYMIRLISGQRPRYYEYNQYLCRSWNETHFGDQQLQSFVIYVMTTTPAPYNQKQPAVRTVYWKSNCFPIIP